MATQVQFRRGTTVEHGAFTGAVGEVTVDTTLKTLKVHDGSTTGGIRIAKYSDLPSTTFNLSADDSATIQVNAAGGALHFSGGTNITTSTDSSGTIIISTDNTLVADLTGNADTATALSSAVTVQLTGDITGSATFTSAGDTASISTTYNNDVVLGTDTSGSYVQQGTTAGNGLSGSVNSEGGTFTVTSNATDANTGSTIVFRDASGDFSAGTITATTFSGNLTGNVTGNADTATEATNVTATANNTTNETVYLTFVDGATGTQGIETDTDLTYNPSTNVLSTTASAAQYADLAERYQSDREYDEGHVVVLGGAKEITESTQENDTRVAGVISERWAYLMNEQEQGPAVALKGKVLCKVVGSVAKGDLLVSSSTPGHAVASDTPNPMAVIGRSMVDDADTHPRKIFIKI